MRTRARKIIAGRNASLSGLMSLNEVIRDIFRQVGVSFALPEAKTRCARRAGIETWKS